VIARAVAWVGDAVEGRVWWYRLPVVVLLLWALKGYVGEPLPSSIFSGINLGFHEMGHAAFFWSDSRILTTAGGTIFEIGIPLAAGAYLLLKQRDPFGAAVCVFWLGTALVGVGIYAADARAQSLPLVSPFGPIDVDSHDWSFMLMKYGKLTRAEAIGARFRSVGMASMWLSLAVSGWVLRVMAVRTERAGGPE